MKLWTFYNKMTLVIFFFLVEKCDIDISHLVLVIGKQLMNKKEGYNPLSFIFDEFTSFML